MIDPKKEFNRWCNRSLIDHDLTLELKEMKGNYERIQDAFYKNLDFGTGGLRGIIGAGTNRMNVYTVQKVSQGIAEYICKNIKKSHQKVAISYDSRIKSDVFAKAAASVFAANGIKVFIYETLMPVPCLSFATRELKCAIGVMITASHNPSKYNGYKVYGPDGCQVISEVAGKILDEINSLDIFKSIKSIDFSSGIKSGVIEYIPHYVYENFLKSIKKLSMLNGEVINRNFKIIYSPLHGSGLIPITQILKESGYKDVIVVKEQEKPDGSFTTCPYPNPEIKEAMALGIQYCQKYNADILIATDPDCDRVGIAVKDNNNEYVLLTGNETGILLLNYILEQKQKCGDLNPNKTVVKTIVTTDLAKPICEKYGVTLKNVLTGFKYIGDQIAILEKENRVDDFLFGFEESYGYLSGTHVRDKDGVNAAFLICEMFAYYKNMGISLFQKLQSIYNEFGYYQNSLKSYEFPGSEGFEKMQSIMNYLRNNNNPFPFLKIKEKLDYLNDKTDLPKSNVLKLEFCNGSLFVRPSGTEPKLKLYLSLKGDNSATLENKQKFIFNMFEKIL